MSIPSSEMRIFLLMLLRCAKIAGGAMKMLINMLDAWVRKGEVPKDLT